MKYLFVALVFWNLTGLAMENLDALLVKWVELFGTYKQLPVPMQTFTQKSAQGSKHASNDRSRKLSQPTSKSDKQKK